MDLDSIIDKHRESDTEHSTAPEGASPDTGSAGPICSCDYCLSEWKAWGDQNIPIARCPNGHDSHVGAGTELGSLRRACDACCDNHLEDAMTIVRGGFMVYSSRGRRQWLGKIAKGEKLS